MAAGAVGGYFGARMAAAGHDVAFIARGAHLHAIRRDSLGDTEMAGEQVSLLFLSPTGIWQAIHGRVQFGNLFFRQTGAASSVDANLLGLSVIATREDRLMQSSILLLAVFIPVEKFISRHRRETCLFASYQHFQLHHSMVRVSLFHDNR